MTDTRTLPDISEVEPDTPYLADVKKLWRANRRYLGFLPEGGFIDRALKGTLLLATRGDATLGYVLYDLPRDRVKIVHLCVAREARGEGVARALIEEVSARHQDRRGLELKCRRYFAASKLWPELGFHAVLDVPGRSSAGHLLTVWQLAHEHDDLFTLIEEDRDLAVIDSNVFKDLISSRPQGRATRNLADDWVSELVELCATDELWHEINNCDDAALRAQMFAHAGGFRRLAPPGAEWEELAELVSQLAPRAGCGSPPHRSRRGRGRDVLRNARR